MDLDRCFITSVIRDNGYYTAKRNGISVDMLHGPVVAGWEFLEYYVLQNGCLPSESFFLAKTHIQLEDDFDDPIDVLIKEIKDRALWNKLTGLHEETGSLLENRKPHDAVKLLQDGIRDSYNIGLAGSNIGNLLSIGQDVWDFYQRLKNGERGIQSPWRSMNEMTMGWWAGDFITFVARMGVGKSWLMILLARQAWLDGKRVLFVGTEMNRIKLAMRFYSVHLKLPYQDLRHGRLGVHAEQKMKEAIDGLSKKDGFNIVGDDFNSSMSEIEGSIDQVKPDILLVDGMYLIKNQGKTRTEIVSKNAEDLKILAKSRGIPVIASTQFNRDVVNNSRSSVDASNVALSDNIAWVSDVMFGLYQTDDMKEDSIMGFRPLKLREGDGSDFFSRWDFDGMNFEQDDQSSSNDVVDNTGVEGRDDDAWDDDGGGLF